MIDFHCHIDLYPNATAVLDETEAKGIYVLAVTTTPKAWTGTKKLIGDRRRIRIGLGLHPELVADRYGEVPLLEHFLPETNYVGEIGLDGSPHLKASFKKQDEVFQRILRACSAAQGKILSIHSRRASSGVIDALQSEPNSGTPILHWFSGSLRELDRAIATGCWFSVGPLMLSSAKGRRLVELMPRERVLTETDAPFAQIAGIPLMPWDVDRAFKPLSEIWRCDEVSVSNQLLGNLRSLVKRMDVYTTRL
ncbi:Qat anti-phage system TatD family nuclease QatD [Sphingobium sp. AN641]|uniref:Qat anti-phage system TatD family nuclease QatD n=1 Tax=Sphingobium sp. AN641 TaxID=3133443 RepID=UPI0030C6084F